MTDLFDETKYPLYAPTVGKQWGAKLANGVSNDVKVRDAAAFEVQMADSLAAQVTARRKPRKK